MYNNKREIYQFKTMNLKKNINNFIKKFVKTV